MLLKSPPIPDLNLEWLLRIIERLLTKGSLEGVIDELHKIDTMHLPNAPLCLRVFM